MSMFEQPSRPISEEQVSADLKHVLDSVITLSQDENGDPLARVLHINHITSSFINYLIHEKHIQFSKTPQAQAEQI